MGIFSKLVGDLASGKDPLEAMKKAAKDVLDAAQNAQQQHAEAPRPAQSACDADPEMPSEPNQYNFPGTYTEYFRTVFAEAFPAFETRWSDASGKSIHKATKVEFLQGGRVKLVVELKSDRSESNVLRRACEREGVPFLRFYYDHYGWWNTRAYVEGRVRAVLG